MRIVLLLSLMLSNLTFSQREYGEFVPNVGVSHSLLRAAHKLNFLGFEKSFDFKPGIFIGCDVGFMQVMSVGLSFVGQDHTLHIEDYNYVNTNNSVVIEDVDYRIRAWAFNVRVLAHADVDGYLDFYGGLQYSFMYFRYTSTSSDPNINTGPQRLRKIPSLVAGVRYYPIEPIGIYTELAIPGVYTISMGLCFRFSFV